MIMCTMDITIVFEQSSRWKMHTGKMPPRKRKKNAAFDMSPHNMEPRNARLPPCQLLHDTLWKSGIRWWYPSITQVNLTHPSLITCPWHQSAQDWLALNPSSQPVPRTAYRPIWATVLTRLSSTAQPSAYFMGMVVPLHSPPVLN